MSRIKEWLKHLFLPHEGNDQQPHILRNATIALLIGVALAAEGGLFVQRAELLPHSSFLGAILNSVLVDETNVNRADAALNALKRSPVLEAAAQAKADDMASKGYFAHTSPQGITPWHWFELAGYNYQYAGENLAIDFTDSKDVTNAWMNSPLHRANILNQHFTEVGIATASGMYEGKETTFVVQLFGTPAPVAATISRPVAVAPKPLPQPKPVHSSSSNVLGENTGGAASGTVAFVATSSVTASSAAIAGSVPQTPARSFAPPALVNPRHAVDALAFFLLLLIGTALALKINRVGFMYPHLIRNGILAAVVLIAVISLNHTLLNQVQIF